MKAHSASQGLPQAGAAAQRQPSPQAEGRFKDRVVRGVAWAGLENWGRQLLGFLIYAVLARLVGPESFGLVALAAIYVAFIEIFVTQGLATALIQREELEREHLDAAFLVSSAAAVVLCLTSIAFADATAWVLEEPELAPLIRWLSLALLFYALASVPVAILTREMAFRSLAFRTLSAMVAGGAVGLAMAFSGWGVWSLVGQQLTNGLVGVLCLWLSIGWRPRLRLSGKHLKDLYGFASSILANNFLWFFSQRADQTLVGYSFGAAVLGPYAFASRIIQLMIETLAGPLQAVSLPAFSRVQHDAARVHRALCKFSEMGAAVAFPAFTGIAATAPLIVPLFLGQGWEGSVPVLQALALYGAVRAAMSFSHPFMLAMGRPALFFGFSLLLAGVSLGACSLALRFSPTAVALAMALSLVVQSAVFLGVAKRLFGLQVSRFLAGLAGPAAASALMLAAVTGLRLSLTGASSPLVALILCVGLGMVAYAGAIILFRRPIVAEILSLAAQRWQLPQQHPVSRAADFLARNQSL